MKSDLTKEQFWSEAWIRHIEGYLAAPPRTGYWLESRFGRGLSVLELAGGSCRDSRYLATRGVDAIGSDFDTNTLDYLSQRFPESPLRLQREDGFALSLADKAVDLSFSNGFWVLFGDDDKLRALAREQARVTRRWMLVIAHNALNEQQRRHYADKVKTDPLYDIRFFTPDEVVEIVRSAGIPARRITCEKFGGPADALFRPRLKGLPNILQGTAPVLVPRLYALQPWRSVERVACIVELAS